MAFNRTSIAFTGTTTNGSTTVTTTTTGGLYIGLLVYSTTGIQADTTITAINAGVSITLSKAATASGSRTITGQYITQSGTDADPSGLEGITGVTTIARGTGILQRRGYNLGTNQLRIQGNLTHDSDLFEIISDTQFAIKLEAGCTYNLGVARTINGQTSYSKGTGLAFAYNGALASQFGLWINGGTFNWNGGVIKSAAPALYDGGTWISNTYNSVWQNANAASDHQLRCIPAPTWNAITLSGIQFGVLQFLNGGFNAATIKYENTAYQTPAGGGVTRTITNPIFTGNQSTADIRLNQLSGTVPQITQVKNPDRFPIVARLNNNALGDVPTLQTVTLNITDVTNANATNVVAYIKDSNNGSRLNTNASNYVNDRTYVASSNASGVLSLGDVLTLAAIDDPASATAINYDYRSNFGNNSADFRIYLGGYEYLPTLTRQTLMGNGGKSVAWTMFDDTNVSLNRADALNKLSSSFTINTTTKVITVTANSTYDDLYDITKVWKYNGTQTNVETPTISDLIISASGSNLIAYTGWNLVVNTEVSLSTGTKFTKIKFDTITINGTGAITGIYQTNSGTSTIWEFGSTGEPVLAGTSLVIYDNAKNTKYYNAVTTDGVYRYYIPPQSTGATYTYAIERYGYRREEGTFPSNAGGILFYVPNYSEDVGITQTNRTTVNAYTTLADTAQIYDATANFRLTETGIKLGQLVARDGTFLDFGSFNVKFKDDATAIVGVANGTITYKSIVVNESTKYNAMKATPPATITPTDTEQINVLVEDANGDSQVEILGGDNLGYELWKVTTATATDDYATGTLLTTLPNNNNPFRFIGISGFDIVGRDISSGVRRRSSMIKGSYTQAFYVGNQIQLATDAPQLIENNEKLAEVILKLDTNLDAKVSTRLADADYIDPATAQQVWEYTTRTLTSAGSSGATLAEIEASTVLAKKAQIDAVETKVDALPTLSEIEATTVLFKTADYVAPDNTKIADIKTKVDTLNNTDLTGIATATNVTDAKDQILTEIGNIPATDLTGVTDDLTIINENIKDASLFIPASRNL